MSSVMELLLLYINATSAANLSQPPASITLGGKKRCIISLSKAFLFFLHRLLAGSWDALQMRSVSQDDLFNVLGIFTGKNQPSFNSPELHRQNLSL